jgi:glucose-1-phosphate thymidylyltransferase
MLKNKNLRRNDMRGIILAAGKGTRLYPITLPCCKPLLPVYDKPMIYYPLSVLMEAGVRDILVITPPDEMSSFENLMGDGSQYGVNISYVVQKVQRGIADAFIIGKEFIGDDNVCLALGDNIFFGPDFNAKLHQAVEGMEKNGAAVFGYYVEDPRPFGVVEFNDDGMAVSIEEKPAQPKSNYIVPGLYFYNNKVVDIAAGVQPSARGELEITSVNNAYLENGELSVVSLNQEFSWFDAGNANSLLETAEAVKEAQASGSMIACPEEIGFRKQWITADQLKACAEKLGKTEYGKYLAKLV